jgi:chitin disaccharide deacetylase
MKATILILFILVNVMAEAQQNPPRLIVRGDDMGYTHSGNEAIIKCYKQGIESSIEVLVVTPWFPETVKFLAQNPGIDVGVHLALTSEWDNLKWRPLTDCQSLKDKNGYFYPKVFPDANYPGQAISEHDWKLMDIEKEFRAQIELALRLIPRISHVSAHMNCDELSPKVAELIRKLAKEYKIDIDLHEYQVINLGYGSASITSEEKIESFLNQLNTLEPGKTYCFIDHPGFDNDELRAVSHIGYEDVSSDRQGVTEMYTSEKVKSLIRELGIQLIGYRDLPGNGGSKK